MWNKVKIALTVVALAVVADAIFVAILWALANSSYGN